MQQTVDLLTARWREQVDRVTDLSLRLHSLDDTDPGWPVRVEALEAELTIARQALADIDAELAMVP